MNRDELRNNIDTIVVVIMENRSFDHVLGHLSAPEFGNRADIDGIRSLANPDFMNPNTDGVGVAPFWMADGPLGSDLPHGPEAVQKQLAFAPVANSYQMTGFVKAYEDQFHSVIKDPPVMGLLRPEGIPTTAALAAQYTVCDRWFACLPTSTAPNRLMSMCGYSDDRDTGTVLPDQRTAYDWLSDHGVRWRVYHAGLPFFALMPRIEPMLLTRRFRRFEEMSEDLAKEGQGESPQVVFIEPDYYDSPVHFRPACDNHAPLAMAPGEAFLADIYRTLTSHPERWSRTLFVVTYDEHGGFYDHVAPPKIRYANPNGVTFASAGPRVPAIIGGPFASPGASHALLDNTSILQLFAERFGAPGEAYSPQVAARAQQSVVSLSSILSADARNTNVVVPGVVRSVAAPTAPLENNNLRVGFTALASGLAVRQGPDVFSKFPELRGFVRP